MVLDKVFHSNTKEPVLAWRPSIQRDHDTDYAIFMIRAFPCNRIYSVGWDTN